MPKFYMAFKFEVECNVEAESLEAAELAARHHCDGPLQEWAEYQIGDNWETEVWEIKAHAGCDPNEIKCDMGVAKNDDGEWEAVALEDAARMNHNSTIKGYQRLRCPECGEEGSGVRFFRSVPAQYGEGFGMIECPNCGAAEKGPEARLFDDISSPVMDDDKTLPLFAEDSP